MRILMIEDDREIGLFVKKGLLENGYVVEWEENGEEGLFRAITESFDLAIIDRMLPGMDGLTALKAIRAANKPLPTLFLSAMDGPKSRIEGLRAGAQDYLSKPFSFDELLIRIEILLAAKVSDDGRRSNMIKLRGYELDTLSRKLSASGNDIPLKTKEFEILKFLMERPGQVVTRTLLLEKLWDYNFDPQTNIIDVHVSRLRQKIEHPECQPLIETVRGVGYRISA